MPEPVEHLEGGTFSLEELAKYWFAEQNWTRLVNCVKGRLWGWAKRYAEAALGEVWVEMSQLEDVLRGVVGPHGIQWIVVRNLPRNAEELLGPLCQRAYHLALGMIKEPPSPTDDDDFNVSIGDPDPIWSEILKKEEFDPQEGLKDQRGHP